MRRITFKTLWMLGLSMALAFALSACGSSSSDEGGGGNTTSPRSDATLSSLQSSALTAAEADEGTITVTPIDATNADAAGNAVEGVTGTVLSSAGGAPTAPAAVHSARDVARVLESGRVLTPILETAASRVQSIATPQATSGGTINVVGAPCPTSGTVDASGSWSFSSPDGGTGYGTYSWLLDEINVQYHACNDGFYTVWGDVYYDSAGSMTITMVSATADRFAFVFDDYFDGGFVVKENVGPTYWNFALRWDYSGSLAATIHDDGSVTDMSGSVTATTTINGYTCTGSAEVDPLTSTVTETWSCSAAP